MEGRNDSLTLLDIEWINKIIGDDNVRTKVFVYPSNPGKTHYLQTLQQFFSPCVNGQPTRALFETPLASALLHPEKQGQYEVIFLDFGKVKAKNSYELAFNYSKIIQNIYKEFAYLANSPHLNPYEKKKMKKYLNEKNYEGIELGYKNPFRLIDNKKAITSVDLAYALKNLANCIATHRRGEGKKNAKPLLLIDNYDDLLVNEWDKEHHDEDSLHFAARFSNINFGGLEACMDNSFIFCQKRPTTLFNANCYYYSPKRDNRFAKFFQPHQTESAIVDSRTINTSTSKTIDRPSG